MNEEKTKRRFGGFDMRDAVAIAIIILAICLLVWVGLKAEACVDVMNLYNEHGGYDWVCQSCDMLKRAGVVTGG